MGGESPPVDPAAHAVSIFGRQAAAAGGAEAAVFSAGDVDSPPRDEESFPLINRGSLRNVGGRTKGRLSVSVEDWQPHGKSDRGVPNGEHCFVDGSPGRQDLQLSDEAAPGEENIDSLESGTLSRSTSEDSRSTATRRTPPPNTVGAICKTFPANEKLAPALPLGGSGVGGGARGGEAPRFAPSRVVALVCGHALSSSLLLVVNKWALKVFPYVWVLTMLQFLPAALLVGLSGALGFAEVDALSWQKLVMFFPAAGMFFITMTAGNAVVKHSNVDTFIVMRSLVPIPCAFLETLALGEPCPRPASWVSLCALLLGAVSYASANRGVAMQSSSWMLLFLVMMPIDAVLIKHLINTIGLSQWGLVLYQNLLAALLGLFCVAALELNSWQAAAEAFGHLRSGGFWSILPVVLSCMLGVSVSYFQMSVRKVVSSTAFMVLGVSNKLLALLINQLAMEANGSFVSIMSVLVSIGGAVGFQQTVKGNGLSQAPPARSASSAGNLKAFGAMAIGLVWAGILHMREMLP